MWAALSSLDKGQSRGPAGGAPPLPVAPRLPCTPALRLALGPASSPRHQLWIPGWPWADLIAQELWEFPGRKGSCRLDMRTADGREVGSSPRPHLHPGPGEGSAQQVLGGLSQPAGSVMERSGAPTKGPHGPSGLNTPISVGRALPGRLAVWRLPAMGGCGHQRRLGGVSTPQHPSTLAMGTAPPLHR